MKTCAGKNTVNILKVKLLKILCCCLLRQSPIQINVRFCYCIILTYIPILTTETLHWEVQPGKTFKKYTVKRNMLSELCIVKIDLSHTGELIKECKILNVYQVNIWKNLVFIHQIN